jgi:hypothetical protein
MHRRGLLRGVVIYDGPSVLNGEAIIAIATFRSLNDKTGDMIQTWILLRDQSPIAASEVGADVAICGVCPLRHFLKGPCYVAIGRAPQSVWTAFRAGAYPVYDPQVHARYFKGRGLRLGSYGDPAAVPFEVWAGLVDRAASHTGYTHQMAHRHFDRRIATLCMVSADTPNQARLHQERGYSTFRVRGPEEPLLAGEQVCTYEVDKTRCEDCGLCQGIGSANIASTVHGVWKGNYRTAA